jgi:hypothetical protein
MFGGALIGATFPLRRGSVRNSLEQGNAKMKVVSGLFDSYDEASAAVDALEEAGVPSERISLVGPDGAGADSAAAKGAGVGAAVGGIGGLLAGLGAFAIPGIGPVVGAGWLAATLVGAAAGGLAGGLIGSLTDAGIEERDAHVYAEGIKRGGTMVTSQVDDNQLDAAAAILDRHGRVDVASRRAEYMAEGWTAFGFDEDSDRPVVVPPPPAR